MNQITIFFRATFMLVLFFALISPAKAANSCGTRQNIDVSLGSQTFQVTTTNANDNATSGAIDCGTTLGTGGQHWFWFTWNKCSAGTITLTTQVGLTDFDTKLHVFTGGCGNFSCVIGDDDSGDGTDSYLQFVANPGTNYYIRLGGFNANQGTATLSFIMETGGCTDPSACNYDANADYDDCSCCYGVCAQFSVLDNGTQGPNAYAEISGIEGQFYVGETYNICLPENCILYIDFYPSNVQSGWQNTPYQLIANGELYFGIVPDPWFFSFSSIVLELNNCGCMDPEADNYDPANTIDGGGCLYFDDNINCANAEPYTIGSYLTTDIGGGAFSVFGAGDCIGNLNIRDLWYSFVYEGGAISFELGRSWGANVDPILAVYDDCGNPAIHCNDDIFINGSVDSRIDVGCADGLQKGETYYLRVAVWGEPSFGALYLNSRLIDFSGCTDPLALNFNDCANLDDGSCFYDLPQACEGDLDHNGSINVNDLLIFLTLYNTTCN